ncbi:unnamed protein product [Bemisia tabaci]|uniref:LRRCT domain-containing protein n=1 Tax=Bemisia tabaci TaxID=7038 RepID=A0A9P0AFS8_BEMTA|nr:unnamed protein product [Bemisia tabaci]
MRLCWWWTVLVLTGMCCFGQYVAPCNFNSLCTCKYYDIILRRPPKDVSCVNVPFFKLPETLSGKLSHIDVVKAGMDSIDSETLTGIETESLRLMNNEIVDISDTSFSSLANSLRFLDLSYNKLDRIPIDALKRLKALDWLNLQGNEITGLDKDDWSHMSRTLRNLFVGENNIDTLSTTPDESLARLKSLTSLNLDYNELTSLDATALPANLQTLSVAYNQLKKAPLRLIETMKDLVWVSLQGNSIKDITQHTFKTRKNLEKLDLSENAIEELPNNLFNGSITIRDLNLAFNNLKTLLPQTFRGLSVSRLYLPRNQLENLDDRAFVGIGHTLEHLDLEHNFLTSIPKAVTHLKKLKFLYMSSNRIPSVDDSAFDSFAPSLKAISLSGNQLTSIPSGALRPCRKLLHLNLGYNQITDLNETNFEVWAGHLDTLVLRNNKIVHIPPHTFRNTPRLRELSLSFNKIVDVDIDAFVDLAECLQSLEISFGLFQEEFPDLFLKPLTSLLWLALDNNNFHTINSHSLRTFSLLQYLNLDSNRISALPSGLFHPGVHGNLRDIRLAYNLLQTVDSETFSGLPSVETIVLSGNRIQTIRTGAFRNLTVLMNLVLSNNAIAVLQSESFANLPNLLKLDLQNNGIKEFSLSAFRNVSNPVVSMSLNVSRNQISFLTHQKTSDLSVHIGTLDMSYNSLMYAPVQFFGALANSLRVIHLSHNSISELESSGFVDLKHLASLSLDRNQIANVASDAFLGLDKLQILDLSHNKISRLQSCQFKLRSLRVLRLSNNMIRSLARDTFQDSQLEVLDMSYNSMVALPSGALAAVGLTLRQLDMSHNAIEHLDMSMFLDVPLLTRLNVAFNRLTILPDNVLASVGNLLDLNLGGNLLRSNYKELFHYVRKLRKLDLSSTGLKQVPPLPLPDLKVLCLSDNLINSVPSSNVENLQQLRYLHFDRNQFVSVPSHVWPALPRLKFLNISSNPIKILSKDSFSSLHKLESLDIQDLPRLERFDSDALARNYVLRSISVQTWPHIEKYRFRLGLIISSVPSLRSLSVKVLEAHLNDQLLGSSPSFLTELKITGSSLKKLEPRALTGLVRSRALTIRIHETQIEDLPPGLFASLVQIPVLSLDLVNNRLSSLSPASLYSNATSWESIGTKLLTGGLVLEKNPWACDCGLVWLGHWLRRWLREALQIHTVSLETAQQLQEMVRRATCLDPRTNQRTPLIELYPHRLSCHASALSRGGSSAWRSHFLVETLSTVLVVLLSRFWWAVS